MTPSLRQHVVRFVQHNPVRPASPRAQRLQTWNELSQKERSILCRDTQQIDAEVDGGILQNRENLDHTARC